MPVEEWTLEFTAENPTAALGRFVELATPVFVDFGGEVEGRGSDWTHWTFDRHVARAYAFETGVSVRGSGGAALPDRLRNLIASEPEWRLG